MKAKLLAGLSLALLALGLFWPSGCASLQPGADPFVVGVERTQNAAGSSLDFVLRLDQTDRGFWRTNAPAFHQFCEWLRVPTVYQSRIGPTNVARAISIQLNVQDLKVAYKANRAAGNSNVLWSAWSILDTALSQAVSWSTIVTNKTLNHL